VLFPRFARAPVQGLGDAGALFRRSVLLLFLVLYPVTLGIALFADELLSLWIGAEFAGQSHRILQVFALGILVNCLAHVPFTFLQAVGRARTVASIHLFEFPLFVLVLWVAAQTMGLMGAVFAWLLRMIIDTTLMFYFAAAETKYGINNLQIGKLSVLLLLTVGSYAALYIPSAGGRVLIWAIAVLLSYLFCWNLLLRREDRVAVLRRVSYVAG
jgi:O-antigen/teichoic acid export membrane protein